MLKSFDIQNSQPNAQPVRRTNKQLLTITDLTNPKILLSVLQTACVCIFRLLIGFFAHAPQINQNKKVSMDTFSVIHLVRRAHELTFSIIQTHCRTGTLSHSDAFILFTSAQVALVKDCRTLSLKATHHVSSFC